MFLFSSAFRQINSKLLFSYLAVFKQRTLAVKTKRSTNYKVFHCFHIKHHQAIWDWVPTSQHILGAKNSKQENLV